MAKTPITEAKTITVEAVLELGKHYSSKDLRSLQTKLTSTSRELHGLIGGSSLLGRIGGLLSFEQRQLLRDAAKLIQSVGLNIEHAKEKRQRSEVSVKKRKTEREIAARKLVEYAYPLPSNTLAHKLEIIRLALVLNRARCFHASLSPVEFSIRYRNYVTDTSITLGTADSRGFLEDKIASLRSDLKEDIQAHLALDSKETVQERFLALQREVGTHYPLVADDHYEIITLHLWSQALSSPEVKEADQ